MKKSHLVCLGVPVLLCFAVVTACASESFAQAERVGESSTRYFFAFSTSAGGYIVRHDGVGEYTSPTGLRRYMRLRVGAKERIDRMYFLEHQGDLFLVYEGHNETQQSVYLARIEQQKRKPRWLGSFENVTISVPLIEGEFIVIGDVYIRKSDGHTFAPEK